MDGQTAVAFEHARGIVEFERGLGLFFEPGLQHWVTNHMHWFIDVTSWCYVNMHLIGTTAFMLWLYFTRRQSFPFVRNMFMIAMGLALVGYVVFPTAPPRFLPEWGFADTVANFVGTSAESSADVLYNPFAAMPSMHVAFALMIAVPAIMLVRHRVLQIAWSFYPAIVPFVVVVPPTPFWLDAAGGVVAAAFSAGAATAALARARPEAWAFRRAAAEAAR